MALPLPDINAYTSIYIVPKLTDVIYLYDPVFVRLSTRNNEQFRGGIQVQRPIMSGKLTGGPIGRGGAANIDFVTTASALTINMKLYYVNITLYGFDSMLNDGNEAVFSQIEEKMVNAGERMAELLGTDMYLNDVGARTLALTGFSQWIDDGNVYPTIGGITRSDISPVGTVGGLNAYTATLTSFTLAQVNTAYSNAWIGPEHIDLVSATQNFWNLLWQAMQPNQRYMDEDSDIATAGFQSFRFNAAEVAISKLLPTGTNGVVFGMNTKTIEWYFSNNQKFQYGFTGFKEAQGSIDVAGQFLAGNNLLIANPRLSFKLLSTAF